MFKRILFLFLLLFLSMASIDVNANTPTCYTENGKFVPCTNLTDGIFLPLSGGTLTGHLLFTDNTYDIGATGATRPRNIYAGTAIYAPSFISPASANPYLLLDSTGTTDWYLGAKDSTNSIQLRTNVTVDNSLIMELFNTGKLSVNGIFTSQTPTFTGKATSVLTGSIDATASTSVTGVNTLFLSELNIGDRITVTGETRTVTAIASDTALTVDTAFTDTANDASVDRLPYILNAKSSDGLSKFIINDLGYVGIGSTSATIPLEVDTTGTIAARFAATSTGTTAASFPLLMLRNLDATNNNLEAISFRNSANGFVASIEAVNVNHNATATAVGDVRIVTNNSGGYTEKFRVKANGHIVYTQDAVPTVDCTGGAGTVIGTDNAGRISYTGASQLACKLTFATAWNTIYGCVATAGYPQTGLLIYVSALATDAVTFNFASYNNPQIYYHCFGN